VVEDDRAGAGGALVKGKDVFHVFQILYKNDC